MDLRSLERQRNNEGSALAEQAADHALGLRVKSSVAVSTGGQI